MRQEGKEYADKRVSSAAMYRSTDRERQRYVKYTGNNPLPTFKQLFGSMGEAAAGIQNLTGNIIRVNATHVDHVRAAICLTHGCRSIKITSSLTRARA